MEQDLPIATAENQAGNSIPNKPQESIPEEQKSPIPRQGNSNIPRNSDPAVFPRFFARNFRIPPAPLESQSPPIPLSFEDHDEDNSNSFNHSNPYLAYSKEGPNSILQ